MESKMDKLTNLTNKESLNWERFEFLNNDLLLKGKILLPNDIENCKGFIIFVHGLGYCNKSYEIDDAMVTNNGWAFVKYNLRGHAGVDGEWTINDSVNDLIGYTNYLKSTFTFKNKDNIGFIAHSTGGLIAILAYLKSGNFCFGSIINLISSLHTSYYWWFKSGYSKEVQRYFAIKGIVLPKVKQFFEDITPFKDVENDKILKDEYSFPYRYGLLRGNCFHTFLYEIKNSPDILKETEKIDIPLVLYKSKVDEVIDNNVSEIFFRDIRSKHKKIVEVDPDEGSLRHFLLKSWP